MALHLYQLLEPEPIWRNLAREEWLFETLAAPETVLMLWRSDPCVVIGRNQVPWRECRVDLIDDASCALARRSSGGGAVYHDHGNLNITVMMARPAYNGEWVTGCLVRALGDLGIDAEVGERHTLTVDGRKCSGAAFRFRRGKALHHATLLVDANLDRLESMLQPLVPVETRAVASIRSEVVNVCEVCPGLSVGRMAAAVAQRFRFDYPDAGLLHHAMPSEAAAVCAEAEARHRSDRWRLMESPAFTATLVGSKLTVRRGVIAEAFGQTGQPLPHLLQRPFQSLWATAPPSRHAS